MIEMKRVRLINWHNFVNDTVDFDQVTYMVGVNAVGKTTILDAIRYCLTTSKSFNALGNKKSGRTLQGSVHGKQREENRYTRPGHTVSYIGIEFQNQEDGSRFVITVRVESESPEQELRQVRQTWYISPKNCVLEDLPFLDPETHQPTSRDQFCTEKGKMQPIERQKEAQGKICQRLGIGQLDSPLAKKFGEVFPMGTSIEEISDFKSFIYDYILPQPAIDLEEMQQDEVELERLEEVLVNARSRADRLQEIVDAGQEARKRERDIRTNQGLLLCAENREKAGIEEEILKELEQCNIRWEQLKREEEEAAQAEAEAMQAYKQAIRDAGENDIRKKLEDLEEHQKVLQKDLREAQQRLSRFHRICEIIESLGRRAARYGVTLDEELLPEAICRMPARRQSELESDLIGELGRAEAELDRQRDEMVQEQGSLKARLKELRDKIQVLSEGNWVYPDGNSAQKVKDEINRALADQGMEPDARIVCELLYMEDDSWQSCAEACLGGRRFDIFVSPEHYRTAKYAYEKLGAKVQKISLLDSRALERNAESIGEAEKDTLAAKVKSENHLVAAYVTDLLGRIVCCETSDSLEDYPHSATRDLLRHYPYRLARLRQPQKYIGQDARREQLEQAKAEAETLYGTVQDLEESKQKLHALCREFSEKINKTELQALSGGWDSEARYDECVAKCRKMQEQIEECQNNPLLMASMDKEKLCERDYEEKKEATRKIGFRRQEVQRQAERCQEKQEQAIRDSEAAEEAWQSFVQANGELQELIEKKYGEALRTKTPAQVMESQQKYQSQLERGLEDYLENSLKPLQREYNQLYTCDFALGMEGFELYRSQHDQLVCIELEKYQSALTKAKERCKKRFRQDILSRLKDGIVDARNQFHELNRTMKELRYGEETYKFYIGPSEEPQLAAFCKLIEHSSNQPMPEEGTLDALARVPDEAYENQIDDLMERIMADLRLAAEQRQQGVTTPTVQLSSYVDYRQYLNCDIEITNSVTGKTTRLSSVSGDSSGGENQAPFYIAICASLLQIYQKCQKSSIRLILLDEAFSKMTSDRIRPMMKMFRDMNMQVVMITTVEKASAIAPFCDITHSIIKKGARNAICPFYLEEE